MKLTGPEETKKRAREQRASMSLPERMLWRQLRLKQTGLKFASSIPLGRTLRIAARDVLQNLDGVLRFIVAEARTPSDALCASAPPEGE